MSWFNTSGIATLAKSTLTHAQKAIDKALDIHEDPSSAERSTISIEKDKAGAGFDQDDESFFAAFGLDESPQLTESKKSLHSKLELPIKSLIVDKNVQSMWGSFTGSFFESGAGGNEALVNRSDLEKNYGDRLPEKTIASQPKTATSIRERHQSSSLDEQAVHVCEETDKDQNDVACSESFSKQRVRSSSESILSLTNAEYNCSEHLTKAESLFSVEVLPSQKAGPARVCRKRPKPGKGTTLKKKECELSINKDDQQVADKAAVLVKDKSRSNLSCADASEPVIRHENEASTQLLYCHGVLNESDDDSKKPILEVICSNEISSEKTFTDSSVKTVDGLFPLVDLKAGSTSLCSVSSSSTTGESSSTLEESVGTLSALSERDGHSSATLTPDLFADMGEYSLPTGMSSSWDVANVPQDVNHHNAPKNAFSSEVLQAIITPCCEHSQSFTTDTDVALEATELQLSVPSFREETVLTETDEKSSETTDFVCYMLEVAMEKEPSVQPKNMVRSHSPHSTNSSTSSATERSDPVKTVESDQNSGHTSGDEIETTTSSDIEIISSPSAGGESGCERMGSLSPIKQNSQWKRKAPFHTSMDRSSRCVASSIRSESPASDTSSTRDSIPAQYSFSSVFKPDLAFSSGNSSKGQHQRNRSEASSDENEGSQAKIEALIKKLSEVNTVLEAREAKVLELNRENLEIRERGKILKAQLQKAEEVRVADYRDVSTLTKEFTERFSSTEKKLQQALKEKDNFKSELQKTVQEISTRVSFAQVEEIKKEKDTQISELMQEGEKLSKQLLGYSNNVKKLRAKEKDNDTHIKQQRAKLEEQSRELDRIRKALGAKEEVEKNQIDLIRQLTNTVQKYEKELDSVKSELEDSQEQQCSIKVAVDSAYKELDELHRKNTERDSQMQEAALSAEMLAKEELKACLEQVQLESRLQQENLMLQIGDLRMTVVRNEKQSSRREDTLRQDIANLQERLQEAEGRNEELNQNVSAATRPLFRQIDNLQSTLNIQTTAWERVERNLTDRLNEAQNQLAYAVEKELAATERYAEISSKVASFEAQCSLLRQERTTLHSQLASLKEELHVAQELKSKDSICSEAMKQSFAEELSRLKRDIAMLEHQLDIEKTALDAEKRKNIVLSDQLKEKITNFEISRQSSPSPQANLSMRGSFSEQFPSSWVQDHMYDSSSSFSGITSTRMNVYESLRGGSTATFVDNLQSQLKLRDGDIFQLQGNISQLERVKESMTEELVKLTAHNEELEAVVISLKEQAKQNEDMQQKYNALLQMYGEISEEAEELKLDLQDVKDMYKAQIDELMKRKH